MWAATSARNSHPDSHPGHSQHGGLASSHQSDGQPHSTGLTPSNIPAQPAPRVLHLHTTCPSTHPVVHIDARPTVAPPPVQPRLCLSPAFSASSLSALCPRGRCGCHGHDALRQECFDILPTHKLKHVAATATGGTVHGICPCIPHVYHIITHGPIPSLPIHSCAKNTAAACLRGVVLRFSLTPPRVFGCARIYELQINHTSACMHLRSTYTIFDAPTCRGFCVD